MKLKEGQFLCPECGANTPDQVMEVSPAFDMDDPVSGVLEWISCAECGSNIPTHIAERWDAISVEEARQEWWERYRNNQLKM